MKSRRLFLAIALTIAVAPVLKSQEKESSIIVDSDPVVRMGIDARFDGSGTIYGKDDFGVKPSSKFGFAGTFLILNVDGSINEHFSYALRYRFSKSNDGPREFINALDWANLTYTPNGKFSITAGKQVIKVGTFEYGYAPINVYFYSHFCRGIYTPYQTGVNFGYKFSDKHQLNLQVVNSTFSTKSFDKLLGYNLQWSGAFSKVFSTNYSLNMVEYEQGHFINYIALGHKFSFSDKVAVELDYLNRYAGKHTAFFSDFSVFSKLDINPSKSWKVWLKGCYDQNKAQKEGVSFAYDRAVAPGTKDVSYGAGVEYFPISNRRNKLRIHAAWYSFSQKPTSHAFLIGIRYQIEAFSIKRK